ncbi:hypothetical protein IAU60_006439 [Kwoniella sp. DSM 27419]
MTRPDSPPMSSDDTGVELHDELDLVDTAPTPTRPAKRPSQPKGKRGVGKWKGKRKEEGEDGDWDLREELEDESIWRSSYINRFFWDGAARSDRVKHETRVLVQGCLNGGGRGWRKEALSREAMVGLSLSYPRYVPKPQPLVVGKNQPNSATPVVGRNHANAATPASVVATPATVAATPASVALTSASAASNPASDTASTPAPPPPDTPPTSAKLTHRQKYEAILAATTRPPPHVYTASVFSGAVVRSDPVGGKSTKGYWGPGRDGTWSHVLWGLHTGSCVHTSVQTKHSATHGGRALSVNVRSDLQDAHEGEITCIWQSGETRWVTGGLDGRVKVWEYDPGTGDPRSGKRTPEEAIPASIACLFTSPGTSLRSDSVILARYDPEYDVACGVANGTLRVWLSATTEPKEIRVDLGPAGLDIAGLEMVVRCEDGRVLAKVLSRSHRSTFVTCDVVAQEGHVRTIVYDAGSPITALHTSFTPSAPIGTSEEPQAFGGFFIAGDASGYVHILALAADATRPLRSWDTGTKVTAIDYSCGLVAVGRIGQGQAERQGERVAKDHAWEGREGELEGIHQAAVAEHDELAQTPTRRPRVNGHEANEIQAMEEMGLEDGEDALQYAMLLSMEGAGLEGHDGSREETAVDAETREAIRQVEAFQRQEEAELEGMLEMIRLAEGASSGPHAGNEG